jgi:uncharacterized protein
LPGRVAPKALLDAGIRIPVGSAHDMTAGSDGLRGWGQRASSDPTLLYVRGFDPEEIVLFGRSLGAAVAAWLAAREAAAGLIVESAFTSVPDLGQELYPYLPVRWLSRFDYPTLEYVRATSSPVLVVHSREDEITPFHHGEALHAAAARPHALLELRGTHNEAHIVSAAAYVEGLQAFLAEVIPAEARD